MRKKLLTYAFRFDKTKAERIGLRKLLTCQKYYGKMGKEQYYGKW